MSSSPLEETPCLVCGNRTSQPYISTPALMCAEPEGPFTFVECPECGLIYLNPRVAPADLGRFYPDYYLPYRGASAWGRYAPIASRGQAITDRKRARITERALRRVASAGGAGRDSGARRVLDVGCGHPSFLARLRDRDASLELAGIDFVASGWQDEPELWHGLELSECEPVDYTPGPGLPPDVITMWHYLEHDYHPRTTLSHMRTIAHDQTRLIIEVPNVASLSRHVYGASWQGWHTPRHTALYARSTLTRLLESSGWAVERYTTRGTLDIYALWWMSAMEKRGIDWRQSLESRFPAFMVGRILSTPLTLLDAIVPLGVQLVTARPQTS